MSFASVGQDGRILAMSREVFSNRPLREPSSFEDSLRWSLVLVFVALMYPVACLMAIGIQSRAFANSIASLSVNLVLWNLVRKIDRASCGVICGSNILSAY